MALIAAFLGALMLTPSLSHAAFVPLSNKVETDYKQTSVVILGGGVAGITAAQTLHEQGIHDFIIVEYNNEIGGRNHHATFGKRPDGRPYTIELGSNWVQEISKNNPVWRLVQKYDIKYTRQNYDSVRTYNETGPINIDDVMDEFDRALYKFEAQAERKLRKNHLDQSERAGLIEAGWFPGPAGQAVEWWHFDSEGAIPPDYTSQIFNDATIPGSDAPGNRGHEEDLFVFDQRGFNYFVRREADTFLKPNDPRLLLNTIVTNVAYDSDGVTVHTKNGTFIRASHAICTFSLGVLQSSIAADHKSHKANHESTDGSVTFSPPLPAWKRRSIANFCFGTYTKVFLQFPRGANFWPNDTQFAMYADPTTRGNFPIWQSLSLPGFFPDSGIVFGTLVSPNSAQIEAQTDEETRNQAVQILRNMFGADKVPEPTAFLYPRWGRLPWARGSFSYWPVGVTLEEHENLRATVDGRLWFAGEHTSSENQGFLHGAWFEGKAAAERVVKCLRENKDGGCNPEAHYSTLQGTNGNKAAYNRTNGYGVADL